MIPPTIDLVAFRLREIRPDDAVAWHAYLSDPKVTELTSYQVSSLRDVEAMIGQVRAGYAAESSCTWALAEQANDELVGTCGFNSLSPVQGRAEMAYDLARPFWGRGLMGQAVRACVEWAFAQPELNRIQAFVMVGNERSERVLERAHFTRECRLKEYRIVRGEPRDYWLFSLVRRDWQARYGASRGDADGARRA